jgi:hypothetical protein
MVEMEFYIVVTLLGQFVDTEICSSSGRANALVKIKDISLYLSLSWMADV